MQLIWLYIYIRICTPDVPTYMEMQMYICRDYFVFMHWQWSTTIFLYFSKRVYSSEHTFLFQHQGTGLPVIHIMLQIGSSMNTKI